MSTTHRERAFAALKGLATGDAIGKQTENLTQEKIRTWYPGGLHGFEGPPGQTIPRYEGNARRQWRIGETTDDTERTLAVAAAILRGLPLSHATVGEELLKCRKSVHPGVRSLWEFHQAGDPARIADCHDGCGAAIRVAPVGIVYRPQDEERLIAATYQASISTHGGAPAIAAAVATAAAISAAVEGQEPTEVSVFAIRAARTAERRWLPHDATGISQSIVGIRDDLLNRPELRPSELAEAHFPNNPQTIVPLAIALATVTLSAQQSILLATNIGGDSDSVASIAGALAGAMRPETVNDDWYRVVEAINQHRLATVAEALAERRQ